MKNRKDFIKDYIRNNLNSTNIEEAMNATFEFCNDFIEVKDELPSEENGFLNKLVIIVLENVKNHGKHLPKIGRYCKEYHPETGEEVFFWRSGIFVYGLDDNETNKVIAWRPINFD